MSYPPVTKCDGPIARHLGTRVHRPEESWALQDVKDDFAVQLTSDHDFGYANRDQFPLSLRSLGFPSSIVT